MYEPAVRLPFEPLFRISGCETISEFAAFTNAPRSSIQYVKKHGEVTWKYGDRLACALGFHPFAIWEDAWLDAILEVGERRARWRSR